MAFFFLPLLLEVLLQHAKNNQPVQHQLFSIGCSIVCHLWHFTLCCSFCHGAMWRFSSCHSIVQCFSLATAFFLLLQPWPFSSCHGMVSHATALCIKWLSDQKWPQCAKKNNQPVWHCRTMCTAASCGSFLLATASCGTFLLAHCSKKKNAVA